MVKYSVAYVYYDERLPVCATVRDRLPTRTLGTVIRLLKQNKYSNEKRKSNSCL
jgi:hypothetical protein